MLQNGYVYPKSIFLVEYFVSISVNGWFKLIVGKIIFEFANFGLFLVCMSL